MPSYLVETYLGRGNAEHVAACEHRARCAADELAREGLAISFGGSIHVPEDELCFFVFSAPTGHDAERVAHRADLQPVRVVQMVSSLAGGEGSATSADET